LEAIDEHRRPFAGVRRVKRVVVTGSECTGKTTLARGLAEHFGTIWTPEHVRDFVRSKGAAPTSDDVEAIARGQMAIEDATARGGSRLLVLDTDLLSTIVYSHHYYDACPGWIEDEFRNRSADLYLLAGIDVPWAPDGIYRDRGDRRVEMQGLFRKALVTRRLPFVEVDGPHTDRMEIAIRSIEEALKSGKRKAESGNS
jgi:NadR type nicotinamide-nucleotide adenylyltransferase